MRKLSTIVMAVMFLTALLSIAALGQTTYTWNQTTAAAFGTAANWTPTRSAPATSDVLVIDGSVTPTTTITGLATQTIGQLMVIKNAYATLTATSAATLTIGGGAGTDFLIGAGSTLVDSASSVITIALPTGTTGIDSGTFRSRSTTGGAATVHRLTAVDASSLTFVSGSICVQDTNSTGNLFGTSATSPNSVVFQSGSQFIQHSGSNPFSLSAPASIVVFNHGSWYRYNIASGTPSFSGRTYPNLEFNPGSSGTAASTSGGSVLTIDTLVVTSDTLKIGVTGTPGHAIKGNISVAPGAILNFAPTVASTITLSGSAAQTITNSGTIIVGSFQNITLNNSNGFTLNGNTTFNGTLAFTAGKLTVASGTLALGSAAVVTGAGSGKFIDGKVSRLITAASTYGWPAGQNADYLSDSVYASSVPTKGGSLTLQTLDNTVTPFTETARGTAQILKRYVHNSVDTLNFTADSIGLSYATADLPSGVYASNLQVVRWNGGPWLNAAVSRIDSTNRIIYVKSNLGVGDYVVTGPAGFAVLSKNSINYGTVPAGQSKKDSVVINNTGNAILLIDSVTSTLADFTISPAPLPVPIGGPVKFYITYAPTTGGTKNATIVFYHKGINGRDSVSVTGGASLITLFAAAPDSLDFGTRIRNSSKTDTIVVANAGNVSLKIDSVRSPDPAFTIAPTSVVNIAGGSNAKFFITYKPNLGGPDSAKIVFYSNSSTEPDTVYVKGNVVIAPIFSASKASITFPAVLLGTHKMDSVTVTNTGTASLNITSVTWTDTNYVVTPTSATIGIDASQKFYVTFSPKAVGTKNTSIVMTSNVTEIHDTVKVYGLGTNVATIAEARKDLNGDLIPDHSVTKDTLLINGVITSKNLQSVGGQTAIFIQDSTGGVEVFGYSLPPVPMVIGDSVFAIGTVYQYHGATEFEPLTPTPDVLDTLHFGVLKHNATIPKPKHLTLHQLVSNAESYEGLFIEIDTLYKASGTWPAVSTGAAIYVTNASKADTCEMYISSSTDVGGSVEPSYPINVVAVLNQYSSGTTLNNGYEIEPSDSLNITHTKFAALVKISEARKDLNNDLIADHSVTKDTLEVSGVITTPNLQSIGSQTAIFIQDSTAGIEIFNYSLPPVTMVIGDSVFVVGTVSQYRGAVEFTPLANDTLHFGILKHHAVALKPKKLTLHQFVSNPESFEGLLVEIDTLYKKSGTWPGAATGAAIEVNNLSKTDSAELYISSSTDIAGSVEPTYPINVVAVINQYSSGATVYNNGYEIEPGDTSNIVHQVVLYVPDAFSGIPTSFVLENNYPNPFNPTTTILYGIAAQSHVTVKVYSVLGQEIATLVNDVQGPSYYRALWNGKDSNGNMTSSGVYFYRITAAPVDGKTQPFSQVKKMLLMK